LKNIGNISRDDYKINSLLISIRKQRLQELSTLASKSKYGSVYHVQKPSYAHEVTEASDDSYVLVHLASALGSNIESRRLTELWLQMAQIFSELKFCEIRADMAIEDYPEKNCPTILIYYKGDIIKQVVTLRELRGVKISLNGMTFRKILELISRPSINYL